jgi:Uma2 family endonuclease
MSSAASSAFTEAEYLALERASERRHEFVDGAIVAMAGARPPHNILSANLTIALGPLARHHGCVTMTSDQRVHVPGTGLYCYPDVLVVCGERRYEDADPPSLLNPTLLVEVTSDSTEAFDRGAKFMHYQAIPSLREYLIVSHRLLRIDHHRRVQDGQWLLTTYTAEEALVALPALDAELPLRDVYRDVAFDEGRR